MVFGNGPSWNQDASIGLRVGEVANNLSRKGFINFPVPWNRLCHGGFRIMVDVMACLAPWRIRTHPIFSMASIKSFRFIRLQFLQLSWCLEDQPCWILCINPKGVPLDLQGFSLGSNVLDNHSDNRDSSRLILSNRWFFVSCSDLRLLSQTLGYRKRCIHDARVDNTFKGGINPSVKKPNKKYYSGLAYYVISIKLKSPLCFVSITIGGRENFKTHSKNGFSDIRMGKK